jgi:hypothetical protein
MEVKKVNKWASEPVGQWARERERKFGKLGKFGK